MRFDAVELRLIELPFRSPFRTSFGVETHKHAVVVTVRSDGVEGYGEGVMEPLPMYREESIAGAWHLLEHALVPDLLTHGCDDPREIGTRWQRWRGNPMAKAALELAVWDCFARQADAPLRTLFGGADVEAVAVGASIGIASLDATLDTVRRHVDEGYRRIKLKIERNWDVEMLAGVRAEHPSIDLTADANAAYTLDDAAHLRSLDQFALTYIEQPLHWDDLVDHAALAREIATPICLDESLTSARRVREALALGSCRIVNVKVGRVGGIGEVIAIDGECVARNVPMWCGGMFETGVGRAHNIHLATLPGFTLPGDTASASRTFARDIVEQPLEARDGLMPVPPGVGIGVTLDRAFLDEVTVRNQLIDHRRI
jgi:o-succinylbenzoate synthase